MRESFLHFIWQFQKFNYRQLASVDGLPIQVCATGSSNSNAGPDFQNAKLVIDDLTWFGHVELHIRSSDWSRHRHQYDDAYNNVVLHVVWQHDEDVKTKSGRVLPVLELKDRVSTNLLNKCNQLINSPEEIPCASQIHQVRSIDKMAMLDISGVSRLKKKSEHIILQLKNNLGDWEETTYQALARNFGFKTNDDAFSKLSEILKHKLVAKHGQSEIESEALIFGTAGFLTDAEDDYQKSLQTEFDYLAKKYNLQEQNMLKAEWKYLRLRPGNFPSVRLAQFAGFVRKNARCFDQFIHFNDFRDLKSLFEFQPSHYWQDHYDFGKKNKKPLKGIGTDSVDLILINTVVPLLAAYAYYTDSEEYIHKAVDLLQQLRPENNHIIKKWKELELTVSSAFDSQSLIELRNEYCLKKRCLSCKIGVSLINN